MSDADKPPIWIGFLRAAVLIILFVSWFVCGAALIYSIRVSSAIDSFATKTLQMKTANNNSHKMERDESSNNSALHSELQNTLNNYHQLKDDLTALNTNIANLPSSERESKALATLTRLAGFLQELEQLLKQLAEER